MFIIVGLGSVLITKISYDYNDIANWLVYIAQKL